jgi:dihydrodipicolinate synthase/N-acetylneuraminate lyase
VRKLSLSGAYAPIPTPFDADGAVAHDKLAENIARWSETSLGGFSSWAPTENSPV